MSRFQRLPAGKLLSQQAKTHEDPLTSGSSRLALATSWIRLPPCMT
jgi:hypothetical protein